MSCTRPSGRLWVAALLFLCLISVGAQDEDEVQEVAAVSKFQLRFGSVAGSVTAIEVAFSICFSCGGIQPTESIWVQLPGFSRQNVQGLSRAMFAAPIVTEGYALFSGCLGARASLCTLQTRTPGACTP